MATVDPIIDCYLMVSDATGVVERMVVGHAERDGYRFVLIDDSNASVGLGWTQTPSGWVPPVVEAEEEVAPPPLADTVTDLLAQIEELKAKVEALNQGVS